MGTPGHTTRSTNAPVSSFVIFLAIYTVFFTVPVAAVSAAIASRSMSAVHAAATFALQVTLITILPGSARFIVGSVDNLGDAMLLVFSFPTGIVLAALVVFWALARAASAPAREGQEAP